MVYTTFSQPENTRRRNVKLSRSPQPMVSAPPHQPMGGGNSAFMSRIHLQWVTVRHHKRLEPFARWEFLLVALVAVLFRIPPLLRSPFSSDDSLLFLEAGRASQSHLLPITGIYSSLLAMNMPIYTWLLLPFATHPFGMALVTGSANVVAVVLLYLLGARYVGRAAGLIAGLLFATATYPVWMSLFIWQQTFIPVVLVAYFWTLAAGAVEGKRHWLPYNAVLLTILIQVYPLTATLLPLTMVGMLFTWRSLRLWDVALALLGPLGLFVPTLLFEIASGGYDIHVYERYLHSPSHVNGQVFEMLRQAIGALPGDYLGSATQYSSASLAAAPLFNNLGLVVFVLWAISATWLLCTLVAPRLASLSLPNSWSTPLYTISGVDQRGAENHDERTAQPSHHSRRWSLPAALADSNWRMRLILFIWQPIFLAVTIRHSSPIYIHYVFILLPVIYLTIGLALAQIPLAIGTIGGGLIGAFQAFVTTCFVLTLVTGQAAGSSWGGIPITAYARAISVVNAAVSGAHGSQAYIASDPGDPYLGQYWAERQNQLGAAAGIDGIDGIHWTSYTSQQCALMPPHGSGPGAVLVIGTPGLALADQLSAASLRAIDLVPMARGTAYPVYSVGANPASLASPGTLINGELRLDSARLEHASLGRPERIVSYWTSLRTTPPGAAVSEYTFQFQLSGPNRPYTQISLACTPSSWIAGEGIILSLPLPTDYTGSAIPNVSVQVLRTTHGWYRPSFGPFAFETAQEIYEDDVLLPATSQHTGGYANLTSLSTQELNMATFPMFYQRIAS